MSRTLRPAICRMGFSLCRAAACGWPREMAASRHSKQAGFTLIEVSLAVLVVGFGLLSLMSLFPSGLRSGEDATADTRAGLFAQVVLDGMRANAAQVRAWDTWDDAVAMTPLLCDALVEGNALVPGGETQTIADFPNDARAGLPDRPIRYALTIQSASPRAYSAYLQVWERTGTVPGTVCSEFYTEFLYGGR